jgi:hypothetical protein
MAADKNYESHAGEDGTVVTHRVIPDDGTNPIGFSDVLKFSNCTNCTVDGCTVHGGKEDCIDVVRGSKYVIRNSTLLPYKNGITLKGSIDGVLLENIIFDGHGSDCDIDIGQFDNYWWIGRPATRNVIINNVTSLDGKPVVVRLWDADAVTVTASNVKIVRVPKFIWWPYFVFRAAQTRGYKNVTKPVDANTFIKTK